MTGLEYISSGEAKRFRNIYSQIIFRLTGFFHTFSLATSSKLIQNPFDLDIDEILPVKISNLLVKLDEGILGAHHEFINLVY